MISENEQSGAVKITGTQLLDRSLSILNYIGEAGHSGAKPADVARDLDITQSTAHRILTALMRHGLVEKNEQSKRYRLGLALFSLAARAADSVGMRQHCRPSMLRLAAETGDIVFLMARSGLRTVCVDREEGGVYSIFTMTKHIGGSIPLGVGCASEVILATLPEVEAEVVINANAAAYPEFNGLTADEVKVRVQTARKMGYAIDEGRYVEGISGISVPIRPRGGDLVASIAVNMTSARLGAERVPVLLALLRKEVAQIENSINALWSSEIGEIK